MSWACIGWTDAHPAMSVAFGDLGLSLRGMATVSFIEGCPIAPGDGVIFAGSFMRYPEAERQVLIERFLQRTTTFLHHHSPLRIIFISSAAVYGLSHDPTPRREDAELNPQTPYAREKRDLETALAEAAVASGGRLLVLRPAGLFGKRAIMTRSNNLVDRIIAAINIGEPLNLSIESGGRQIRDFLHVNDLLGLLAKCASQFDTLLPYGGRLVLNVSNGVAHSIGEIVDAARDRSVAITVTYTDCTTDTIHCALDVSRLARHFDISGYLRVVDAVASTMPNT